MARSSGKRSGPNAAKRGTDIEEIAPRRFLVRNAMARSLLKGEGNLEGNLFEMTTWRREGLVARLRASNFTVRTLGDMVRDLPGLPPAMPVGAACTRTVGSIERYSYFDPQSLTWQAIEPQENAGQREVVLHTGWVIRRRQGRGAVSYHRVFAERNGSAGIKPLTETEALLAGYAQATQQPHPPLTITHVGTHDILPDIALPPPYHQLMQRLGEQTERGWQIEARDWPLARQIYERLNLTFVHRKGKN